MMFQVKRVVFQTYRFSGWWSRAVSPLAASVATEVVPMNREEKEALTRKATQSIVAHMHHLTNAEEMIYNSLLTGYDVEMFTAGRRDTEEWIGRLLASLPIPLLITRTIPEGSGGHDFFAYHWQTRDREGDAVTFLYGLEQALLSVMKQQEQQP